MIALENIFICLAAPLLIAAILLKGETRRFIGFFMLGLAACLLSAYINSGIAAAVSDNGYASLTIAQAMVQITPICEEILKALPVFFYVAVLRPKRDGIIAVSLAVGLGFAAFENCWYAVRGGALDVGFVLGRCLSAGVMHTTCALLLGCGLSLIYRRGRLAAPGSFALLCAASTFHAIYNLLAAEEGVLLVVSYLMPFTVAMVILTFMKLWGKDLSMDKE